MEKKITKDVYTVVVVYQTNGAEYGTITFKDEDGAQNGATVKAQLERGEAIQVDVKTGAGTTEWFIPYHSVVSAQITNARTTVTVEDETCK